MIEKQNVTLSLPKGLLRKAKMMAIEHETSLSGLMVELLTEFVEGKEAYNNAKHHHLALLAEETDLGTYGRSGWTRDSLHDR
jgi:hypothetical protein